MSECSCKQILNIIPKCDPALNVQPKCPVTLNVVETQRGAPGKDATINGVNVLEIIATDGITGTMEGKTFTISGQELQEDIIAENNRALEAEETLDNKIDSESDTRADEIARVEGLISSEETRAKDVESTLQENIVAEENRARGVEQELSNSIEGNRQEIGNHISDNDNPHEVTKAQVGLGKVENLAPADMPMSTATKTYVDNADTNLQGQITAINTTISGYGDIVTHNANEFATAVQGALADTALQPKDNISELTNNLNYQTAAQVANSIAIETSNRESADNNLQSQIDAIVSASDVFDIVGTYAELQAYDITTVPVNNIIKVLVDSAHGGAASYYRCVESGGVKSWEYIGSEGAYYTKGEADSKFVPQTRTVNGKSLSNDITLTASDVGALPSSTIIPTVNDAALTIQKNGANIGTFTANSATDSIINVVVPTDTSDLTNNAGYTTKTYVDAELLSKQDTLTAGDNIQITNNVISATDTTYTAGTGIDITNGVISNTQTSAQWGNITGTLSDQTDLQDALDAKQNTIIQGAGIDITNNVVSVNGTVALKSDIPTVNNAVLTIIQEGVTKGTFSANASANETIELDSGGSTYTAGNGISISGTTISVADPTLVNTATGANALSVGTAVASGAQSLALGHYAEATASGGVAIGQEATSDAIGAVQIGFGTNDEAGTFKVSLTTDGENYAQYTLLSPDGEIPSDRLGEVAGTLANNNYVLTYGINTGVWKKYTAPTVDQAYSATSPNAQSGFAVASAIANKADNSLANLSAAGKAYAAHLPMPGGNQVTFTLGASGATYTAPGDGWIYVSISCTGVQGVTFVSLYNNTKAFGTKSDMYRASTSTVLAQRCVIPVSKGDVVAIAYSMGTPSSSTCKFIYANGAS